MARPCRARAASLAPCGPGFQLLSICCSWSACSVEGPGRIGGTACGHRAALTGELVLAVPFLGNDPMNLVLLGFILRPQQRNLRLHALVLSRQFPQALAGHLHPGLVFLLLLGLL